MNKIVCWDLMLKINARNLKNENSGVEFWKKHVARI